MSGANKELYDPTIFWLFNSACCMAMLDHVGFTNARILATDPHPFVVSACVPERSAGCPPDQTDSRGVEPRLNQRARRHRAGLSRSLPPCRAQPDPRWTSSIQPHSDDICFSLGRLLTRAPDGLPADGVPISGYVPVPAGVARPSADWVTRTRIAEDRAFAQACGLSLRMLRMPCASLLGYGPFDLGQVDENLGRVETALVQAALALAVAPRGRQRPWLFCPSGIGGHVDHVAIHMAINATTSRWRNATGSFYKDLHYASRNAASRAQRHRCAVAGLARPRAASPGFSARRCRGDKVSLIRHYRASSFILPTRSIGFTPALGSPVRSPRGHLDGGIAR
ncbi:MAG: hypothetical protein IPP87_10995 [Ideonella sp.]|nr:hypothetical protein [Ideonella sp.]